ncbi:hypothetical protein [Pedobacter cryophilus]|uniref:Uncharacterized protein n=1 Tax=Pedobacter cryophilus TaxID=2571271 RepID=A0A4U1C2C3_9SPHI|nr:hypothetical protein [Pedobacter cryophilus]TKB99177.1 hypothetical protein FA046_08710 [Pedobacter cryophilus]
MKTAEKTNGAVQGTSNKLAEIKPAIKNPNLSHNGETKKDEQKEKPKQEEQKQLVPNLESTLKVVADLHQRSIHRERLLKRITELDQFEITLKSESEELESNHFQGCQLMIADDKGRNFATKTSGLITLVTSFIRQACMEKLAEIEANIVFPKH